MLGMTIFSPGTTTDGTDISTYHARMVGEQDIQPATVVTFSDWLRQSHNPLLYGTKQEFKIIKVSLRIEDTTRAACALDISNLCAVLRQCTVKFQNEPYYYDCQMGDTPTRTRKWGDTKWQVDVSLQASHAYLPAVSVPLASRSQIITAQGNLPSPAVATLTPTQDIGTVTLTGLSKKPIIVKNLHANAPVTIDGEACTVTEPDLDKIMTSDIGAGKWLFRKYSTPNIFSPDAMDADYTPTKATIPDNTAYTQKMLADATDLVHNIGYDYLGHLKTAVYVASAKLVSIAFYHDDGCTLYLNNVAIYQMYHAQNLPYATAHATLSLKAGWNTIEFIWINHFGADGLWNINPVIGEQVDQLNAYYVRDADPTGTVNKFPDTDMWQFPELSPGDQTVTTDTLLATCGVGINYKPKFM